LPWMFWIVIGQTTNGPHTFAKQQRKRAARDARCWLRFAQITILNGR